MIEITLDERDYLFGDEDTEPVTAYDDQVLAFGLANGQITAEQALWMHEQGRSWEISVEC